jgi:hypothetical protein
MEIYAPFVGRPGMILSLDLDIAHSDALSFSCPINTSSARQLMQKVKSVYQVWADGKGARINGDFTFYPIQDDAFLEGQNDIASLGLGFLAKAFADRIWNDLEPLYDHVCVTGVLESEIEGRSVIKSGAFLSGDTDGIGEKIALFRRYVAEKGLAGKRCALIYCGDYPEGETPPSGIPAGLTVKRIGSFTEMRTILYGKGKPKRAKKTSIAIVLALTAALAAGTAAAFFARAQPDPASKIILTRVRKPRTGSEADIAWNDVNLLTRILDTASVETEGMKCIPFLFPTEHHGQDGWVFARYQVFANGDRFLKIDFFGNGAGNYAGWGIIFEGMGLDASAFRRLKFSYSCPAGQSFEFKIKDRKNKEICFIFSGAGDSVWLEASIDLRALAELDTTKLENLNIGFNDSLGSASLALDDFRFVK